MPMNGFDTAEEQPDGNRFTPETAVAAARLNWYEMRERKLRGLGLWDRWRCVPPADQRDKPLEEYLPGGSEYLEEP